MPNLPEVELPPGLSLPSERYVGPYCQFRPAGWVVIENVRYPVGFKVVTERLESLGLRKNPNILTYPVGEWKVLPSDQVVPGLLAERPDWGGIWVARTLGRAKSLKKHFEETRHQPARIFIAAVDRLQYANDYRIKAAGVMLLSELK